MPGPLHPPTVAPPAGAHASLPATEKIAASVKVFAANNHSSIESGFLLGGSGSELCESADQLLLPDASNASRRWITLGLAAAAAAAVVAKTF